MLRRKICHYAIKIEHAIQNQPCMVKDLKAKFGGDRSADRKVMEALDELVHDAVVCQKSGVFFTARSGRAEKALLCKVVKLGKNFAFVMLEDESGDIFIPGRFTRGAMPGDSVLVEKFAHPRVEGSDRGRDPCRARARRTTWWALSAASRAA